jgi:hypothetical protein
MFLSCIAQAQPLGRKASGNPEHHAKYVENRSVFGGKGDTVTNYEQN